MSFLYPEYLVFVVPIAIFLYSGVDSRRVKLHTAVLILLVLALSRPTLETFELSSEVEGRDIVIALDISYSMRAKDIKPTRYEWAKEFIKEFLKLNPNDNAMLIAFTTNPLLLCPPTTDHTLILTALESLNLEYILTKGTSLEKLFIKLQDMGIEEKELLIISDGGEEDNLDVLVNLLEYKTKSFSILALGDASGMSIEKKDGTLLKDSDGNLVISRTNPLLKELSDALQGSYVSADGSAFEIAKQLSKEMKSSAKVFSKKEHKYLELYQIPLLLASMIFLIMHTKAVKYLVLFLGFLSLNVDASMIDDYYLDSANSFYESTNYIASQDELKKIKNMSLESEAIKANTLYKMGEFEAAIKIYMGIKSTHKGVKKELYYNIANSFVMLGRYSSARVFYAKVLQLAEDRDAEFNLELIAFKKDKAPLKSFKTMPKPQKNSSSNEDFKDSNKKAKSKSKSDETQDTKQKYPISSKSYELINKGYIDEKKPW